MIYVGIRDEDSSCNDRSSRAGRVVANAGIIRFATTTAAAMTDLHRAGRVVADAEIRDDYNSLR